MEVYETNSGQRFIILSISGKSCTIQFVATGSVRTANIDNVRAGKVKDLYAITRYGAGYLGDYDKSLSYWREAKQLWGNILKRCYCEADKKGYFGKGITVDARWLCFANFLKDISKLENFDKWLEGKTCGCKYNLDKDLKVEGCRVYSKETCWFIPESINKAAGAANGKPYTKKQRVGST